MRYKRFVTGLTLAAFTMCLGMLCPRAHALEGSFTISPDQGYARLQVQITNTITLSDPVSTWTDSLISATISPSGDQFHFEWMGSPPVNGGTLTAPAYLIEAGTYSFICDDYGYNPQKQRWHLHFDKTVTVFPPPSGGS